MINLKEIGSEKVQILPNRMYYIGHSDSPKLILVVSVNENYVNYVNYPYYGEKELRQGKREMVWLMCAGIGTRKKQMEVYAKSPYGDAEGAMIEIKKHEAFLNGGNEYEEVAIESLEKLDVEVKPNAKFEEIRAEVRNNDVWYYLEQYGCVGGYCGEREGEYVVNGIVRGDLDKMVAEGYVDVINVNKI